VEQLQENASVQKAKAAPGGGPAAYGKKKISLKTKLQPSQSRGQDTYEVVLATAGRMLTRIGFEQLTTNSICEEAGLTPPALYRYFPNKYAILKVLGERLMTTQDRVVLDWIARDERRDKSFQDRIDEIVALQSEIIAVTRRFPGGVAINRAIRAVPVLQRLHIQSREMVAERIFNTLRDRYRGAPEARFRIGTRLVAEFSSAVTQMIMEEPNCDRNPLIREAAYLFVLYFESLRSDPLSQATISPRGSSSRRPAV
jgi:AcrR family transcriptional regulator